jgi:hypothetical protein
MSSSCRMNIKMLSFLYNLAEFLKRSRSMGSSVSHLHPMTMVNSCIGNQEQSLNV